MLSSITPLGERGRNNRWWRTVTAYGIGSLAGGAVAGGLLGLAGEGVRRLAVGGGSVPAAGPLVVLALAAALGLAADLGVAGLRVPTIRRQVDETWIGHYRGWVYGIGYGFQLGLGVVTIVTSAITWVAWAAAFLTLSTVGGLVVGATFGLVRALPLLTTVTVRHPAALADLHRRNQSVAGMARRAALGGQIVVAATALVLIGALA